MEESNSDQIKMNEQHNLLLAPCLQLKPVGTLLGLQSGVPQSLQDGTRFAPSLNRIAG